MIKLVLILAMFGLVVYFAFNMLGKTKTKNKKTAPLLNRRLVRLILLARP